MSTPRDTWPSPIRPLLSFRSPFLLLVFVYLFAATVNGGKLLVVYIDAMRWDYVERRLESPYQYPDSKASPEAFLQEPRNGLFLMKRLGSFVKRVKPVFPTQCLPNIISAFTGRFPRHHGMLGNQMYDAKSGFHFNYHLHEDRLAHFRKAPSHWWEYAEPLWETLEKRHGRRASIYNVPTAYELRELRRSAAAARGKGEVGGKGEDQSIYHPYVRGMTWPAFETNLMDAVGRLRKNETDLAVVYTDLLDRMGHSFGPQSVDVENVMKQLDAALHIAMHEIHLEPAASDIHMMLLSDHGMQEISQRLTVHLDWYMLRSSVLKVVNDGTVAGIWPEPKRTKEVYDRLMSYHSAKKGFSVISHDDAKIEGFFGHDPRDSRTPPVVVVASHGYVLITREFPFPREGVNGLLPQEGLHGYHPNHADMHTAMMVAGPKVHGGLEMSDLNVTEIYQLMCHLLGIPAQPHNGSFENVGPLLRSWSVPKSTEKMVRAKAVSKARNSGAWQQYGLPSLILPFLHPVILVILSSLR